MEDEYRSQIIHEMQVLDEKLGKLFIAIIRHGVLRLNMSRHLAQRVGRGTGLEVLMRS